MSLKNTTTTYGSVAKFFHWLIFLIVLWQFVVGFFSEDIEKALKLSSLFPLHKQIGLAVLLIIVLRLLWVFYNPRPMLPENTKSWERIIMYVVHGLLYASIIIMSLSGWIMSTAANKPPAFFGFNVPFPGIAASKPLAEQVGQIHLITAWILIVLVSLHVLAALKHHFINRDNILRRMLPGY